MSHKTTSLFLDDERVLHALRQAREAARRRHAAAGLPLLDWDREKGCVVETNATIKPADEDRSSTDAA